MNQLTMSAGVAAIAVLLASSAQAVDYLQATFTGPDGTTSWVQDFAPTPLAFAIDNYTSIPVWDYTDSIGGSEPYAPFVSYYSTLQGGGWGDPAGDFGPLGDQVYGGTEDAPIFSVGSYVESDGTLTLTSVPEPATWVMMLVGFGLVAASMRGRRSAVSA